jgi:hypothetical protein
MRRNGDGSGEPRRDIAVMAEIAPVRRPIDRFGDAIREIGTLILAFAPLDAVFSPEGSGSLDSVLLFLLLGLSFFLLALLLERRRAREH